MGRTVLVCATALICTGMLVYSNLHARPTNEDKFDKLLEFLEKKEQVFEATIVSLRAEIAELKKPTSVPPTQPLQNPKSSSVRLENETNELAKVRVNDDLIEVEAKRTRFVTVPAGQFTYQVVGVHDKPILSELSEGQVYGLAIRTTPKVVKKEETKPPLVKQEELPPKPPQEEEKPKPKKEKKLGNIRLSNKNGITIPFGINGKTYAVESGQELLVKIPAGRCVVEFPGFGTQQWAYTVGEGETLWLGCTLSVPPPPVYYHQGRGCGNFR